jgi:hypothetical protein
MKTSQQLRLLVLMCLLVLVGCDHETQSLPPKTLTQTEQAELWETTDKLWAAMDANDVDAILDMTHPRLFEMAGGKEAMRKAAKETIADLDAAGIQYESIEKGELSSVYTSKDGYVVFVPRTTIAMIDGKRVRAETFLIAVGDSGRWKFLDSNALRKAPDLLRKLVPGLPSELNLPNNEIKIVN